MTQKSNTFPSALRADDVPAKPKSSSYPAPFAERVVGRTKRALGDAFGLNTVGVNLTTLAPGAQSALLHRHTKSEEFVYILSGTPTLVTDGDEKSLEPGMCAGFIPDGPAHHLVNRSAHDVVYLEIGDRPKGDAGVYPNDDLVAEQSPDGGWVFKHKDGTPY